MTESGEKLSKRRGGKNKELVAGVRSTTAAKKDGKKVEREGGGL